jgi:hypothetical protein
MLKNGADRKTTDAGLVIQLVYENLVSSKAPSSNSNLCVLAGRCPPRRQQRDLAAACDDTVI